MPIHHDDETALLLSAMTSHGESLAAMSAQTPVLLVLLRHEGCTFCRNAMSDIARLRQRIEQAGTRIALGHMGTAEGFVKFAEQYGLASVAAVADPDRALYLGLGLKHGRWLQLIGPQVLWQWLKATLRGHMPGLIKGDTTQMPGAFLLHQGHVVKRYAYRDAADRPNYISLATPSV